jgi:hypothetical protein
LLAPADYASMPVHNLAPKEVVEYDATSAAGNRIVLMRPDVDWSYDDFRFFYGTPEHMVEQELTNASRGSSTYLTFVKEGVSYDVVLPSPQLGDTSAPRITGNGTTETFTYRDADAGALGSGLTYLCL